jgi:cytochrome b subunit of formate dehydrogenase
MRQGPIKWLTLFFRRPSTVEFLARKGLTGLLLILALVCIFPINVSAKQVTIDVQQTQMFKASDCLECHSDIVPLAKYLNSVHGANSCTSCHTDVIDLEKHAEGEYKPLPVNCGRCHAREAEQYEKNVHKISYGFDCTTCHSVMHEQEPAKNFRLEVIKKCTECHENEEYVESGHDAAVLRGNPDSAVCSDCHGLHNTHRLHADLEKYPEEARAFYNKTCKRCHGDKKMMKRNNLTTEAVDTYEKTYHGKIQKLGYNTHVAGCADCHTHHNILPKKDPKSSVHPDNLIKNCGRCHDHANANFVQYKPHADYTDRKGNPLLFWTMFLMTGLLIGVFFVFWMHTALWWRKTYWENQRLRAKGIVVDPKVLEIENPGEYYTRFPMTARIMHVGLILVFLGLVLTGIPLKFSSAPWAQSMIRFLGGASVAGFIHRLMASVLILLFTIAVVMSFRFLFNKKNGATFFKRLTSPDSLFFRKKDWEDFRGMMRWFLDSGPMPKFDRWTYWEKFDFLAVFWGMAAIGLSGLMLWAPELAAKFLPGWVFNVAIIIHSDEAMLAAGFIFTVHFFNTHFIPTKFPMDTVIFTGRIQKYKFLEEKPLHYERLKKEGRLEKVKAENPDILTSLLSGGMGLVFIAMGVVSVVLIIIGLLS